MIRSYIIHMDGSTARAPLVAALRDVLPNPEVLPAVVGRDLSADERARVYQPRQIRPYYPFDLSFGEIGCFLSHQRAWEKIVASGDAAGLIVEDDIVVGDDFAGVLDLAVKHIAPDRLIRFPLRDREEVAEVLGTDGTHRVFRPQVIGLTTGMQIVGRDAAARLLQLTQVIDRPVDTFLQMRWHTGVDVMTLAPAPVRSAVAETGGSTIQTHQSFWAELQRSWRRMRYRSAVKRLSGQGQ